MSTMYRMPFLPCLILLTISTSAWADVTMPALFSDHMVLQRDMNVPIWGWAEPGEKVTVTLPNQKLTAESDGTGRWQVTTPPLAAGGAFMLIIEGENRLKIKDVQVGEVWLCSGQSNMEWSVSNTRDADLEIPAANYPNIRMITVATEGSQEPLKDFEGHWEVCSPKTVGEFSAVGYFFGRELHQQVKVPIGLVDNAWGGSACDAWIRRDLMEGNPLYEGQLAYWDKTVAMKRNRGPSSSGSWPTGRSVPRRRDKPTGPSRRANRGGPTRSPASIDRRTSTTAASSR
jgi:sialate O-acetylesterase